MVVRVFLWALLPGWLILFGLPVSAQDMPPDTVQQLPEVPIRASRSLPFSAGSRIQLLDTFLLRRQPGIPLAEVLQQRSQLYLKSYGNGMLATVAFRGTTASQTAVLWNGLNIALPTLGLADFALLPSAYHTQVTLQHGPSGALHGSGAIGGAVLLDNPVSFKPSQQLRVQQEVGSFGHLRSWVGGHFSDGRLSAQTSISRVSSQNNFRFQNTTKFGKPWERQENAAFRQLSLAQDLHYKISATQRVSVRSWYVNTHRQVQPSMGSANNQATQADENLRLMAEWQGSVARGTTTVRSAYFRDQLDYFTPGSQSYSTVHTLQTQLEHERYLTPTLLLQAGTEGQMFKARVSGYGRRISEQRYAAYAWLRYEPIPELQLSLNLRQAWVQGFKPPLTPTLGTTIQVLETASHVVQVKGSASRSYRVPTLNDRYWRPGGNLDLRPEAGWGFESGLAHELKQGRLRVSSEVTVYALRVRDWIQWAPAPAGYPAPFNLNTVRGRGVEFTSRAQLQAFSDLKLSGGLGYAYTVSEQELPNAQAQLQARQLFYVPYHKVATWAEGNFQNWFLSIDAALTGSRFMDNDNRQQLPAYTLVNAAVGKTIPFKEVQAQVSAQVQNLTNTVYQTMAYRAMPPRHFRLFIGLLWNRP